MLRNAREPLAVILAALAALTLAGAARPAAPAGGRASYRIGHGGTSPSFAELPVVR